MSKKRFSSNDVNSLLDELSHADTRPMPDGKGFVEWALTRIEQEREKEDEIINLLDAHFASMPEPTEDIEDLLPCSLLDGEAFVEYALARIEREEHDDQETIAQLQAYFDSIRETESGVDETERNLEQRIQDIENKLTILTSNRATFSEQSESFVAECEQLLDDAIATWQHTPHESRSQLMTVSVEILDFTEEFKWCDAIAEKREVLKGFVSEEYETEECVELRQHLRSTFPLAG